MEWIKYEKLSSCKAGDTVKLAAVIHTTDDFLKFLNQRGLQLGLKLKVNGWKNLMVLWK